MHFEPTSNSEEEDDDDDGKEDGDVDGEEDDADDGEEDGEEDGKEDDDDDGEDDDKVAPVRRHVKYCWQLSGWGSRSWFPNRSTLQHLN